jgi:Tol biopolymer transport system component
MIRRHSPGPAWSPDGRYLAVTDRAGVGDPDSIWFVSVKDGTKKQITSPGEGATGDHFPAFSPDGRWLAFLREMRPTNRGEIYVQAVGGGEARQVTSGPELTSGISWISENRLIFSSKRTGSNQLWTVTRSGGSPEPFEAAGRNALQPSASRDGKTLVYTDAFRYTDVWRLNIGQKESRREPIELISSQGENDSAQYSPDGNRIAFVSDRSGTPEIWICNADGSHPEQLTSSNGLPVGTPRWSPDGKKIVYDSVKDGYSAIFIIGSDGGAPVLFAAGQRHYLMPSWSRDGRYIYFASDEGRTFVLKKPVYGGDAVKIATDGGEVFESPDGRTLYRLKRERGIVQRAMAGGAESAVPGLENIDTSRYVAVSGKGIYYLSGEHAPWTIRLFDFKTHSISPVATLRRAPDFGTPSLSVSPDDQWLLFSQLDQSGSGLMMLERFR